MRYAIPALVLVLAALHCACGGTSPAPQLEDAGLLIDVSGSVIGPEDAPVSGASVALNGHETTTDALGIFILRAVPVDAGREFLEVHKEGYFFGGRQLLIVGPDPLAVKVRLLPRALIGSFMADAGGVLRTAGGLAVQIPADAIEGAYQGEVRVYGHYVDPTSSGDMQGVPGLGAVSAGGDTGLLQSYGMGHVELEDTEGNPLQLAAGIAAQLTMPVPADLLGDAQASIPLWYFDEALGIWIEDGSATLQGETYVGDVSHFSLWNCDDFIGCSTRNYFTLSCGGTPVANMPLVFRGVDSGVIGTSVTSDSGGVGTYLPCAEEFEIYVIPPGTGGQEFLLAMITASSDSTEGVETVPVDGLCGPHASVTGRVVDGAGNPITNGYMFLEFDELKTEPVFFDSEGRFLASYFDYTPDQLAAGARTVFWDLDRFIRVEGPVVPFNELLNTLDDPIVIDGSVATVEGRVYVAGIEEDFVYCIDAADGTVIWSYEAPQLDSEFSPVLLNGRLYVLGLSGELFCLNAVDGTLIWSRFGFVDSFSAVADAGALYLSDRSARIRAIDPDDGSQIWSIDTGSSGFFSAPTIVGDTLYCGSAYSAPGLVALDKANGSERWKWSAPDTVKSSPCVVDGTVFVACDDQKVYALNAETGVVLWSQTVDASTSILGAVTAGSGAVYVQSVRRLTALNTTNGAILWQRTMLSGGDGMRPYLSGDRLYANSLGGPVYCLNAADGSILWQIDAEGPPGEIADHFLVVNGVLFLNRYAEPSTLEARNAQTGAVLWTSEVADDCTAPPVVVDQAGVAHYTTSSGMQQ